MCLEVDMIMLYRSCWYCRKLVQLWSLFVVADHNLKVYRWLIYFLFQDFCAAASDSCFCWYYIFLLPSFINLLSRFNFFLYLETFMWSCFLSWKMSLSFSWRVWPLASIIDLNIAGRHLSRREEHYWPICHAFEIF